MAEAARKTFPMSTFVAFIKGEGEDAQKKNIVEMLSFATKKDIDEEFKPFAAALTKAYVYEQHPELAKMGAGDVAGLGESVSMTELPADNQLMVDNIFAKLAEYRASIDELNAKLQESETKLAETTAKLGETEKQLAEYKGKYEKLEASAKSEGEKVVVASEEQLTSLGDKVKELAGEIDGVQSKIIAILKAAPTGEGGEAAAGGASSSGAPVTGGEPEADFGFGSDPFSDDAW